MLPEGVPDRQRSQMIVMHNPAALPGPGQRGRSCPDGEIQPYLFQSKKNTNKDRQSQCHGESESSAI